jgi:Raf kinase inhibitor-like YbhB/YbcL family protein
MAIGKQAFMLSSPAFHMNGIIPETFTADDENKSPPLRWDEPTAGTKQSVIVCHDPDAPRRDGFTHWVLYGIPTSTTSLNEGCPPDAFTPGVNGTDKLGYTGPAPPIGSGPHHYHFWLYALDLDASDYKWG